MWVSCLISTRLGLRVQTASPHSGAAEGVQSLIFTDTARAALCVTCSQQNKIWTKLGLEHCVLGSEASLSCLHTAVT